MGHLTHPTRYRYNKNTYWENNWPAIEETRFMDFYKFKNELDQFFSSLFFYGRPNYLIKKKGQIVYSRLRRPNIFYSSVNLNVFGFNLDKIILDVNIFDYFLETQIEETLTPTNLQYSKFFQKFKSLFNLDFFVKFKPIFKRVTKVKYKTLIEQRRNRYDFLKSIFREKVKYFFSFYCESIKNTFFSFLNDQENFLNKKALSGTERKILQKMPFRDRKANMYNYWKIKYQQIHENPVFSLNEYFATYFTGDFKNYIEKILRDKSGRAIKTPEQIAQDENRYVVSRKPIILETVSLYKKIVENIDNLFDNLPSFTRSELFDFLKTEYTKNPKDVGLQRIISIFQNKSKLNDIDKEYIKNYAIQRIEVKNVTQEQSLIDELEYLDSEDEESMEKIYLEERYQKFIELEKQRNKNRVIINDNSEEDETINVINSAEITIQERDYQKKIARKFLGNLQYQRFYKQILKNKIEFNKPQLFNEYIEDKRIFENYREVEQEFDFQTDRNAYKVNQISEDSNNLKFFVGNTINELANLDEYGKEEFLDLEYNFKNLNLIFKKFSQPFNEQQHKENTYFDIIKKKRLLQFIQKSNKKKNFLIGNFLHERNPRKLRYQLDPFYQRYLKLRNFKTLFLNINVGIGHPSDHLNAAFLVNYIRRLFFRKRPLWEIYRTMDKTLKNAHYLEGYLLVFAGRFTRHQYATYKLQRKGILSFGNTSKIIDYKTIGFAGKFGYCGIKVYLQYKSNMPHYKKGHFIEKMHKTQNLKFNTIKDPINQETYMKPFNKLKDPSKKLKRMLQETTVKGNISYYKNDNLIINNKKQQLQQW